MGYTQGRCVILYMCIRNAFALVFTCKMNPPKARNNFWSGQIIGTPWPCWSCCPSAITSWKSPMQPTRVFCDTASIFSRKRLCFMVAMETIHGSRQKLEFSMKIMKIKMKISKYPWDFAGNTMVAWELASSCQGSSECICVWTHQRRGHRTEESARPRDFSGSPGTFRWWDPKDPLVFRHRFFSNKPSVLRYKSP